MRDTRDHGGAGLHKNFNLVANSEEEVISSSVKRLLDWG